MKILLLRAAPRKSGATNAFADAFARGLRAAGADFFDVNLCSKKIAPCAGCYKCCACDSECPIDDDMSGLLRLVRASDVVACFSPVYFYGMSSVLKAFFDRCFPLIGKGLHTPFCADTKASGTLMKRLLAFSVASGRISTFEPLSKHYEFIARGLGMSLTNIRRGEAVYFANLKHNSKRVKKIFDSVEKLGREIALGEVSDDTVASIELPIAPSDEAFFARAKIYWNILRS